MKKKIVHFGTHLNWNSLLWYSKATNNQYLSISLSDNLFQKLMITFPRIRMPRPLSLRRRRVWLRQGKLWTVRAGERLLSWAVWGLLKKSSSSHWQLRMDNFELIKVKSIVSRSKFCIGAEVFFLSVVILRYQNRSHRDLFKI